MNPKITVTAIRALMVFSLLTGVLYPLLVTGIAQVLFPYQANGSLVEVEGMLVGSELIGQQSDDPRYFWWRPSAVNAMQGSTLDHPASSGASNYSATNATLAELIVERQAIFDTANNLADNIVIPSDMLFSSASGLDPHISPQSAQLQIERIAIARGLDIEQVRLLVDEAIEFPQLGLLGEPRVNVLRLNLALDALE